MITQSRSKDLYFSILILLLLPIIALSFSYNKLSFESPFLMVFISGSLGIVLLQSFNNANILRYTLPMFVFLAQLLCENSYPSIYLYLSIILSILTLFYVHNIKDNKLFLNYLLLIFLIFILYAITRINTLPLILPIYYAICINRSNLNTTKKASYSIVLLLSLAAISTTHPNLSISEVKYTVISIPVSLFIYLFIAKGNQLLKNRYKILDPMVLLISTICLLEYIGIYFLVTGLSNNLLLCTTLYGIVITLSLISYFWIHSLTKKYTQTITNTLEPWFTIKWEDALSQHTKIISWRSLDSVVSKVVSNDGFILKISEHKVYECGFVKEGVKHDVFYLEEKDIRLTLHKRFNYQTYSLKDIVLWKIILKIISEQNIRWTQVQDISLPNHSNTALNRDLTLRKEITYYLHDNILQNIIATKNIVSMLNSDQVALQDLAISTLSDLNDSIRSQIHEIYPSTLNDLPFERNIHIIIDEVNKKYLSIPEINIKYDIESVIDSKSAYIFYRTLQELLNNTCKYAQAENVSINMYMDKDMWILEYMDDGIPFEKSEYKIKHLGMSSIKQQVLSLNGEFILNKKTKQTVIKLPRSDYENTTI